MKTNQELPNPLTPVNIKAYLSNAFGLCGCSDVPEVVKSLIKILEWHNSDPISRPDWHSLYQEKGIFYLLSQHIDSLGLAEHGTSIRGPWLTDDGKRFLSALASVPAETIESCGGEAYDGLHYPGEQESK